MQTIVVTNTNLFAVAAEYLGDATQWVRIAQINGLPDTVIAEPILIALPPVDATATGGVVTE